MVQANKQRSGLELTVTLNSSAGAQSASHSAASSNADEAGSLGVLQAASPAAASITEQYESTARLQHMTGQVCLDL